MPIEYQVSLDRSSEIIQPMTTSMRTPITRRPKNTFRQFLRCSGSLSYFLLQSGILILVEAISESFIKTNSFLLTFKIAQAFLKTKNQALTKGAWMMEGATKDSAIAFRIA